MSTAQPRTIHRMVRLAWAFATLLPLAGGAMAQTSFVDVSPPADPYFVTPADEDFWLNAIAPADVDGDGDLDFAAIGFYVVYNQSVEDRLVIFTNQGPDGGGNWTFAHQTVPLGTMTTGASDLAWGDLDGDGDFDLAVGSEGATQLFRNDGGVLTALPCFLPGYFEDSGYTGAYDLRSITWADVDNDGDADLLVPSVYDPAAFSFSTVLLRNDGADGSGGWIFTDLGAALDGSVHAQSAWADDDGDGDLDLFLANVDPYTETGFIRRFGNDAGAFTGHDLLDVKVEYGLADWGDPDGDGDLDVLVVGNILESGGTYATVLRVYTNDGGSFTPSTLVDAPNADWLDLHAASWADYDSDGDVDLLVTGSFVGATDIEGHSEIFANDGGTFTALGVALPAPISSVGRGGSFTWFDVDGDGDLDYFVAGAYYVPGGNGLVEAQMHLFRNGVAAVNLAPAAPTGLIATLNGASVNLAWTAAVDDHTPSPALTYDLEVAPVGQPLATAERLPQPGSISAATEWALTGLAPGSYVVSVAAVDGAFSGGSPLQSTVTVPATGLVFSDGFESGATGKWTATRP